MKRFLKVLLFTFVFFYVTNVNAQSYDVGTLIPVNNSATVETDTFTYNDINFNNYDKDDLIEVGTSILKDYLKKVNIENNNVKLFKKILNNASYLPYPGNLKNIIKTSVAFSDANNETDYLKQLYLTINGENELDIRDLQTKGFTVREIETLTGISKSKVSRELNDDE